MPGWLSRAAACASRRTRSEPGAPRRFDRLDRDRPLEAAVPGLVDRAEAAAADAALDQEAVEYERTDQCTSAASPRIRFLLRHTPCFLEDSASSRPGRRPRPRRRPERQQILLRRGLALGGGLLLLILIVLGVKGCLDARKNRALSDYARNVTQIVEETDTDQQVLLRQARRTGQPLGDRIHQPGQRRPQRDGQLRQPRRRPQRAGRHEPRAERARADLRAARRARWTKSPKR